MLQLIGRQTLHSFYLRNHFVAPALDAEAVDIVSAEKRGEVLSRLAQVNSLGAEFVTIKNHLGLRLIELHVNVGEDEHPARHCLLYQLIRKLGELLWLRRRRDHKINREISAAGQCRWGQGNHTDARNL